MEHADTHFYGRRERELERADAGGGIPSAEAVRDDAYIGGEDHASRRDRGRNLLQFLEEQGSVHGGSDRVSQKEADASADRRGCPDG